MEYPCVLHIVYVAKYFRVIGLTLVVLAAGGGAFYPHLPYGTVVQEMKFCAFIIMRKSMRLQFRIIL